VDAATGEFERGYVAVDDMLSRQAWAGEIPVDIVSRSSAVSRTATEKGVAEV
jgi:hypothetical protein